MLRSKTFLLVAAIFTSSVVSIEMTLYQPSYISAWLFAEPLAQVSLTQSTGHLLWQPFIEPTTWMQTAINSNSIEFGHTILYKVLGDIFDLHGLGLFSLPITMLGFLSIILTLVALFSSLSKIYPLGQNLALLLSGSLILVFANSVLYAYTEWPGYLLGYLTLYSLVRYSSRSGSRPGTWLGMFTLFVSALFLYYHTIAYSMVLFLVVTLIISTTLRFLFGRGGLVTMPIFGSTIIGLAILFIDPNFSNVFLYGYPLVKNPFGLLALLAQSGSVTGTNVIGFSPQARLLEIILVAALFVLGLILLVIDSLPRLREGYYNPMDLVLDSLYVSSIVAVLIEASGGLLRYTEGLFFLSIALPLYLTRHISRSRKGGHLGASRSSWIATFFVLVLILSTSAAIWNSPNLSHLATTNEDVNVSNWTIRYINNRVFVDSYIANAILSRSPTTNVYTSNLDPADFVKLYENFTQFKSALAGWGTNYVLVRHSDISFALALENFDAPPLPRSYLTNAQVDTIFSNGNDFNPQLLEMGGQVIDSLFDATEFSMKRICSMV